MENNSKEQISSVPLAAEPKIPDAKDKTEGDSYGKFKTKEGLLEAYNSLESEFTRRCQRIKELESRLSNRPDEEKWSKKVGELTEKYPVAKEMTAEIGEYITRNKELVEDENCLEKALLAVLAARYMNPEKRNKVSSAAEDAQQNLRQELSIKQKAEAYFKSDAVPLSVPEILPQGGELPAAPRVRPKDLREAGEMARKLLKTD